MVPNMRSSGGTLRTELALALKREEGEANAVPNVAATSPDAGPQSVR